MASCKQVQKMMLDEDKYELPISMIDVVFLLLIFFMLSMRFKSTEQKLDANLPKDEGQNPIHKKVQVPTEIRLKIYWANSRGQVIHKPGKPFPDGWAEDGRVIVPLETSGAHIVTKVNKLEVKDVGQLAQTIRDLTAANPKLSVVIDARHAVPFKIVVAALDACVEAKAKSVKFQAPPVEEGGGDDWWWM